MNPCLDPNQGHAWSDVTPQLRESTYDPGRFYEFLDRGMTTSAGTTFVYCVICGEDGYRLSEEVAQDLSHFPERVKK